MSDDNNVNLFLSFSTDTSALDEAMAKAQGEFGHVIKDSKNPHFKNTYASLTAINQAIRPVLAKHGIAVVQWPLDMPGNRLMLFTRVAFKGQFVQGVSVVPLAKSDVQGWGAALTYAKRYTLAAIFGLSEDDDDGESAVARPILSGPASRLKDLPKASAPMLGDKPVKASEAKPEKAKWGASGDYLIKSGQHTGKRLNELTLDQIKRSVAVLEEHSGEGKPLLPVSAAEFLAHAKVVLSHEVGR